MSKIINELKAEDFGKTFDEAAFAEWKTSVEAHEKTGFAVIGLQLAGLLLVAVLGGLVGIALLFACMFSALAIALPKQKKRKTCQQQLGISNSDLKQAVVKCRNRIK